MKKSILVLKGHSQYGVLVKAADAIAEGFRRYSELPVEVVDLFETENIYQLIERIEDGELEPEFIFDMQGIILGVQFEDGWRPANDWKFPIFAWIFDHPRYHLGRIDNLKNPLLKLYCVNQSDVNYIQTYHFPESQVGFLPHGGFLNEGESKPFADKIPAVFLSGGYAAAEAYQQLNELPEEHQDLVKYWIKRFQETDNKDKAYHLTLKTCIEELGIELSLEQEKEVFLYLMPVADDIVRSLSRRKAVTALLDAGIPVAVAGKGWQNYEHPNQQLLTILSGENGLSIDNILRLMSNFQIVLNVSDTFSQGGHERIPTAMLCGSICLSNPSTYLLEKYKDRQEILYYDPNHLSTLPAQVKWVWENQAEAEALTQRAYDKAMNADTWQHRAKEILEIIRR